MDPWGTPLYISRKELRVIYLLSGLLKITCRLILINFRPFQLVGNLPHEKTLSFMLQGNKIDCEDEVKLLGVTFDFKLTAV
jgi:hypothetical protein